MTRRVPRIARTRCWLLPLLFLLPAGCGGSTEDIGGESNWVRCSSDAQCSAEETCDQGRCSIGVEAPPGEEPADEEPEESTAPESVADAATPAETAPTPPPIPTEAATPDAGATPESEPEASSSPNPPSATGTDAGAPVSSTNPPSSTPISAHCAFPSATRSSAPSGIVSGSLPWLPRPTATSCSYALSETAPLSMGAPADELPGESRFDVAFSYDVNGDAIQDLFLRDREIRPDNAQVLNLWVSELADGELRFRHEPCDALGDGSRAGQFFVKDLNGDGVPDIVAALRNGILALVNTEGGFVQALHYDFGSSGSNSAGWASLLDVAVADLLGDAALDLVVGFDRTPDGIVDVEFGVLAFEGSLGSEQLSPTPRTWVSRLDITSDEATPMYFGEFALHELEGERPTLLLQMTGGSRFWVEPYTEESAPSFPGFSTFSGQIFQLWSTTAFGGLPAVAVSYQEQTEPLNRIAWYFPSGDGTLEAGALSPLFPGSTNRELGGGGAVRDNQFVLDADGNDTSDFLELGSDAMGPALAIHLGDTILHFSPAQRLELPRVPSRKAFPFVEAEGQLLGLLIYDGVANLDLDPARQAEPPMFQQFRCADGAPP